VRFPHVVAHDLEGRRYELPDELPEGPRIVLLPFQRWHQILVNGWLSRLDRLAASHPGTTVWEVPALSRMYTPARPYIDGGMRAGIPDPGTRRHTLTTYTDLRALALALDLPDFETAYVLLLDAAGEIAWMGHGEYDDEQFGAIAAALERLPSDPGVTA
jgi:hypothetical protein